MRICTLLLLACALFACKEEECATVGETRCEANVAQICQADSTWTAFEDCTETSQQSGSQFVCCWYVGDESVGIPAGYTCLPPADCTPPQ